MFYICRYFKENYNISTRMFPRKILFILFLSLSLGLVNAQRHEVGVRLGMSNLVGDVGRTNYFLQMPFWKSMNLDGIPFYGGLTYRMNFNPQQTLRFDLGYSFVQFDDAYAKESYRKNRGLKGSNSGAELNAIFEYYFYKVNNEHKSFLSPYVFGGIGGMLYANRRVTMHNEFVRDANGNIRPPDSNGIYQFKTTHHSSTASQLIMAVPFGAGLKYKFNYNWALSGEIMFKPTFSDGIDYSLLTDKDIRLIYEKDVHVTNAQNPNRSYLQQEPYQTIAKNRAKEFQEKNTFGNINSKDWVNSVTLILTYSFGRPPCYCDN